MPTGVKVWNFFLPDSGKHTLMVEKIGTTGQRVYVDGSGQTNTQGTLIFTGPENSLLELKKAPANQWQLLVNGMCVEDYTMDRHGDTDQTLRELRHRPDGSYLICPDFVADGMDLQIIRKFRFLACGYIHEVAIAHHDCLWHVVVDGNVVERQPHRLRDCHGEITFDIQAFDGQVLRAGMHMNWSARTMTWVYQLTVNCKDIPVCWTKCGGETCAPAELPVLIVVADASSPASYLSDPLPDTPSATEEEEFPLAHVPDVLPQGVSYDAASNSFQANIRVSSGKFICLGEFRTCEEAHQKYIESVPIYCPGKILEAEAPAIAAS
eukprot:TRINITY_DN51428_c0_g2_i1.p1 TRINITY_DN51428_c0_g2~~TRINITY_DN51428_c0_g2_i1.p1  ORF type:complete len:323 (-),score=57.84 TRINITY_DN51428_c0_g2_i1:149-1117(-)